jgi:hypothetical protein
MPQLIIYCDESTQKGRFYSDFYGGAILDARYKDSLEQRLLAAKGKCQGEMKWEKISEYNEADYMLFVDEIMNIVRDGFMKIRIMFTQNINVSKHLSDDATKYGKLYYQFVKHAFGLRYCNPGNLLNYNITIYLDEFPHAPQKLDAFKTHMSALSELSFLKSARVVIKKENIADVVSKKHVVLQAVDVVLGAMQFRLNNKHRDIPAGQKRRGKRTRAKERVYRHINAKIRDIYPKFNIGLSTAKKKAHKSGGRTPIGIGVLSQMAGSLTCHVQKRIKNKSPAVTYKGSPAKLKTSITAEPY